MKTNSKRVKELINAHLLECVTDPEGNLFPDIQQASNRLFFEFTRVADHPNNLKRLPNDQDRFADYLNGLPFSFEYMNYNIIKFLNSLGINPTGKTYPINQSVKLYYFMIFRSMNENKTI